MVLSSRGSRRGTSNNSIWLYDHTYVNYLVNFTSDRSYSIACSLGRGRELAHTPPTDEPHLEDEVHELSVLTHRALGDFTVLARLLHHLLEGVGPADDFVGADV